MTHDVAALYVDPRGPYPRLVEHWWDEARDARTYAGPWPVVAHPPCSRWSAFARLNEARWGARVGDDGNCFASALACVERCGGALEHPAGSLAWGEFALRAPARGQWRATRKGWVTEISQSAYGHRARKRTWVYAVVLGSELPPFAAVNWADPPGVAQIGWFDRIKPTLSKREASLTPVAFAEWLISLAQQVNRKGEVA